MRRTFWGVIYSNQFSSIYLAPTQMVSTQAQGARALGTTDNKDIKLDYVIVGS